MAAVGKLDADSRAVMYADIIAGGVPERFPAILRRVDDPSNEGSKDEPTPPAAL